MSLNFGGWIHSFAVTDTQTHKNGYTIYKITSIIFPRSLPQAMTCITVWRRFHDIKRLHREMSRRHKKLRLTGKFPDPVDASYFKRFDECVIKRRKEYILELMDFIAGYPELYKCHTFSQFFNSSLSTTDSQTIINRQPYLTLDDIKSTHGKTISANQNIEVEINNESTNNSENDSIKEHIKTEEEEEEEEEEKTNNVNDKNSQLTKKDYTRFLTPMASIESDDSDYIYEAALAFSYAVQAEANLEYQEAYERYKQGVELLLNGSKDDGNDERKLIAKGKISKYLTRADEIYEKFLSIESAEKADSFHRKCNFQLTVEAIDQEGDMTDGSKTVYLERTWNQLAKYKVIKVLGDRVMQVQCVTEPQRAIYVMKGLEKPSSNAPSQTIFLPQRVPYMVELIAYFQSDHKIFLLLKSAEGGRLFDYVQNYMTTQQTSSQMSEIFPELQNIEEEAEENNPIEQQVEETVEKSIDIDEKKFIPEKPKIKKSINIIRLPEVCLKQWGKELAIVIHSLHSKGIILGDLHMENLLLGSQGQLLLTYFYQHECIDMNETEPVLKAFSPLAIEGHFVAPERPLTFRSDWWSYGVILYQLLLGIPFKSNHPGYIECYGCVQYPVGIEISDDAKDLLDNLLQQQPDERLDFEQLKKHPFFKHQVWNEVDKDETPTILD